MSLSLTSALLLDPHRDPQEIWLVPSRTDGQRGDGSQANPYNCSSLPHKAFTISPLTFNASTGRATAKTNGPHGFATGDLITIGGVDIQLVNRNDNHYVGTFEIEVQSADTFFYPRVGTLFAAPSSSPAPIPEGGSIQCWQERELFDVVMRNAPENCVIHLGVGVFETKGHNEFAPGGWTGKSGQRIVGASMGLTTLKLVNAAAVTWHYHAIAASNVHGYSVENLTVDCNVDGQLSPLTNCGAIALTGMVHHVRLRRVRVIRFGSNGPLGIGVADGSYSENFPIFVNGTDVVDVVYEDCVAEQPGPNVAWNSVILLAAGTYVEPTGKVYYGRALVLRNNYINGQLVYGSRAYVQSLEVDGSNVVTLTTKTPHGHMVPGNVSVQGVKVNGSTNNRFNGVFKINNPDPNDPDPGRVLRYTVFAVDADDLKEVDGEPTVDGDTMIGAPVSSHRILMNISVAEDNQTFTVKTWAPHGQYAPHNLTDNSKVRVGGVTLNGLTPPNPPDPQVPLSLGFTHADNPCNGLFRVTQVVSKTEFKFMLAQPINAQIIAPAYTFTGDMAIDTGHHFIGGAACTGGVLEGNRLLHGASGGPWNDYASTLDLVARNNYYHDIDGGVGRNMGHEIAPKSAASLTRNGLIANCNVGSQEHGLVVGQVVHITDAWVGGNPEPPADKRFNGYHIVTEVGVTPAPDETKFFKYLMIKEPPADADTSPPAQFNPVSQDANLLLENNVIELALGRLQGYWSNPSGIGLGISDPDLFAKIPYAFRQVLLRENVIRQMDGQADFSHFGIIVRASENLRADNNVIAVGQEGVRFDKCVAPHFFNNMSPAGKLLRGYNEATMESQSEMATRVEDALILSL